jgi:peptidoglycan hydrolase-like protein with peptidoglycan-binding domain
MPVMGMPRSDGARSSQRKSRSAGMMKAGVATAAAAAGLLAAGPAAAQTQLTTLLQQGSHGAAVTKVQRALHVTANGRYSPRTTHAVQTFQRKDGLLVDGIVGPQTWDALFHLAPPATSSSTGSAASNTAGTGGYSIPSYIVQCESNGDYSAVNPESGAGGAYQILPSTWQAYGGQGLPQDASPAQQSQIAAEIYSSQGPSAWSC